MPNNEGRGCTLGGRCVCVCPPAAAAAAAQHVRPTLMPRVSLAGCRSAAASCHQHAGCGGRLIYLHLGVAASTPRERGEAAVQVRVPSRSRSLPRYQPSSPAAFPCSLVPPGPTHQAHACRRNSLTERSPPIKARSATSLPGSGPSGSGPPSSSTERTELRRPRAGSKRRVFGLSCQRGRAVC